MADFNKIIDKLIKTEGGYINHPSDKGGETNFGITIAVARENGYLGPMKNMPIDFAKKVYKIKYWDSLKLDQVKSQEVAEILFDISVNSGVGTGKELLQKMINYMSRNNINVDKLIGNTTIERVNEIDTSREIEFAILIISTLQGAHYIECCDKREINEDFLLGWLRRFRTNMEKSLKFS